MFFSFHGTGVQLKTNLILKSFSHENNSYTIEQCILLPLIFYSAQPAKDFPHLPLVFTLPSLCTHQHRRSLMFASASCSQSPFFAERSVMIVNEFALQACRPPSEIELHPICFRLHVVIAISWLETQTRVEKCLTYLWHTFSLLPFFFLWGSALTKKVKRGNWEGHNWETNQWKPTDAGYFSSKTMWNQSVFL